MLPALRSPNGTEEALRDQLDSIYDAWLPHKMKESEMKARTGLLEANETHACALAISRRMQTHQNSALQRYCRRRWMEVIKLVGFILLSEYIICSTASWSLQSTSV